MNFQKDKTAEMNLRFSLLPGWEVLQVFMSFRRQAPKKQRQTLHFQEIAAVDLMYRRRRKQNSQQVGQNRKKNTSPFFFFRLDFSAGDGQDGRDGWEAGTKRGRNETTDGGRKEGMKPSARKKKGYKSVCWMDDQEFWLKD